MAFMQIQKPLKRETEVNLERPTDLSPVAIAAISEMLRRLLADVFALYVKTKSFQWHMHGLHPRKYQSAFGEDAKQIFAMTDTIAERTHNIGGTTLRSISDIAQHQRLLDNNDESVDSESMLEELLADSRCLTKLMRAAYDLCQEFQDVTTASLIEVWINEAENRTRRLRKMLHGQNR
jgi:starvation-inducible DNA-binding protein